MPLAPLGTLTYAADGTTVDLNNASTRTDLTSRPVPDPAGRTVSRVVHTLRVATVLTDPTDTGAQLTAWRRALTTYGGVLNCSGKGFGDLSVNTSYSPAVPRDVDWGPKPQLLSWHPLGGSRAAAVEWACEVSIPECQSARYLSIFGSTDYVPMEFNYKVSTSIDRAGYSRQTYSGHVRIPMTRSAPAVGLNSRYLADTADRYLEAVLPAPLLGFRRERRQWDLDETKGRLDFTVEDEELPQALPEGVVELEADHTHHCDNVMAAQVWRGSLSATYEMANGVPAARAYDHFVAMLLDRIYAIAQEQNVGPENFVYYSFTTREPSVGGRRRASYSITYQTTLRYAAVLTSGLWRPLPLTDHTYWQQSLADTVGRPRSVAGLRHTPAEDAIVDLCLYPPPTLPQPQPQQPQQDRMTAVFRAGPPPPENSFLHYQSELRTEPASNLVEAKPLRSSLTAGGSPGGGGGSGNSWLWGDEIPLPSGPQPKPVNVSPQPGDPFQPVIDEIDGALKGDFGGGGDFGPPGYQPPDPAPPEAAPKFQQRTDPSIYITLEGEAIRAGYPIYPPMLLRIGGAPVKKANRQGIEYFKQRYLGNSNFVPIYGATWRLRWLVVGAPTKGWKAPPTPAQ